jgi:hypothetical protein
MAAPCFWYDFNDLAKSSIPYPGLLFYQIAFIFKVLEAIPGKKFSAKL